MRRLLAVILFCAGMFCVAQSNALMPFVMRNDPRPGSLAVSPSFDAGARTASGADNSNPVSIGALTTTHTPDEVIVFVAVNGCSAGTDSIAVTSAHLTFTLRGNSRAPVANCFSDVILSFSAQSSGTLSSEVITVTCSPCAGSLIKKRLLVPSII
jgi:hypothetical protein